MNKNAKLRWPRWVSEPHNGIYDALNKGIKLATGDIIGFLHSEIYASVSNSFVQ